MFWDACFEFGRLDKSEIARERIRTHDTHPAHFVFHEDGALDCVLRVTAPTLHSASSKVVRLLDRLRRNIDIDLEPITMRVYLAGSREPLPKLVGSAEIAAILAVSSQRVGQLAAGDNFPIPVQRLRMGPVYTLHAIREFDRLRRQRLGIVNTIGPL